MGCGALGESSNVDESGNFSVTVLSQAIERSHGLALRTTPAIVDSALQQPTDHEAFVLNHHAHWFTIRRLHGIYWDLNSTRAAPRPVTDFYLAAYLGQMRAEGYSIFVVKPHDKLPPPPGNRSIGPAGTVHGVTELQAAATAESRHHDAARASAEDAAAADPELAAALEASKASSGGDGGGGGAAYASSKRQREEEVELERALALSLGGSAVGPAPSGADGVSAAEFEAARAVMPGADTDTLRAVALSMRPPAAPPSSSLPAAAGRSLGGPGRAAAAPAPPPAPAVAPASLPGILGRLSAALDAMPPAEAGDTTTRARLVLPAPSPVTEVRLPRRGPAAALVAWAWLHALRDAFPGVEAEPHAAPGDAVAAAAGAAREAVSATGVEIRVPRGASLLDALASARPTLPAAAVTMEDAGFLMQRLRAERRP